PEFLKLNPYGRVPVLVDDDVVVYDSTVINEYLDDEYPNPMLMPEDSARGADPGGAQQTGSRARCGEAPALPGGHHPCPRPLGGPARRQGVPHRGVLARRYCVRPA